jgi:hypothetical protein
MATTMKEKAIPTELEIEYWRAVLILDLLTAELLAYKGLTSPEIS